jgi:3D (Asp-Asp-Asp) domain-containing protein
MSKPLLGGGAVAAVLLSASFLFYAEPSVAETLAVASQVAESQTKQKQETADTVEKAPVSTDSEATGRQTADAEEVDNTNGPEKASAAESETETPPIHFTATAYSLRGRTASGQMVRRGVIAADRRVLPIGTRVRLQAGQYSGEYVVADTGGAVKGRKIDVWLPSTAEALRFGRRSVKLTVLTRVRPRTTAAKKQR